MVEPSQWTQTAVQIVSNLPIYRFLGMPAMRTRWMAGAAAHKSWYVETNPGLTTLNKKVWICDICHKQIHVRKQISIRCNRIEHWVHLRCAGICQAQYTDTWTCHLHKESRLTPHTDITPPHRSRPLSKPPTHSPPTPPTPPHPKHRHMSNTPPVPRGLVKPKPNSLNHSPPSPPTSPRAKHVHMSHTPPTPLTSTSPVLDKTPEPRVPLIHALTATTPHPDPTPALPSTSHPHTLTAHTHATQTTVHASQSPQQPHAQHNVLRQPHKQTKDYHRTTNTTQTHRPSSKSERNLIILQVNINGLRNKLEELKLLIHDTYADIITIQETKLTPPLKPKHQKYITSHQCGPIGCTRQEVGSLHSLETTSHSLQHTYLRLLIHTT